MRRAAFLAFAATLSLSTPAAAEGSGGRPVFAFQDSRISESSGLVDLGDLMVTVNDSGDSARVFTVDPGSGETVGVTDFGAEVTDVEALAPAGPGHVWVGDIGGNVDARSAVEVYRVRVGRGSLVERVPERYRLAYPEGREYDAESLFVSRGRLFLITKSFRGGVVFRAPRRLQSGSPNRLVPVAHVPTYATDAALLSDGRHVLVRSLRVATVFTVPGFAAVGSFPLPRQRQGEGVSVGPDDRIRLSTEGVGSQVQEMQLPEVVVRQMAEPAPSSSPTPSEEEVLAQGDRQPADRTWLAWAAGGALLAAAVAVGLATRRGR